MGSGFLAVIQRWPLFRGGRQEGFHCSPTAALDHMYKVDPEILKVKRVIII